MNNERERLSSRIGFILLSAGCAIGCGNVWRFPWMTGQYGGGGFVIIYIFFLLLIGLPVMIMEFALGRASQTSPVKMYQKLEKPGQKWHVHGFFCLLGNVLGMAFYTVVTGWIMYYFVLFLTGHNAKLDFSGMIGNPSVNVIFLAVTVVLGFLVLSFGIQKGLERISKVIMVILFVLMIALAVRCCFLEGAKEGLRFYLVPEFSKINGSVVVAAMNQAFFTLGIGMGSMAIFGSYIDKKCSLLGESVQVITLDTIVAIIAGLIIFPSCFTYDVEVTAGPSLLFNAMTTVFNNMSNGRIWGSLFFLFMIFAAFSTVLAMFETILACVCDLTGWGRKKGCVVCGIGIFLLSLTTALGYSVFKFQPFAEGSTWLDFWDFIVNSNILPLGAVVFALFCCSKYGWGWNQFLEEANAGNGMKVKAWMKPVFKYVVPITVLIVYIFGLATFNWN